MKTMAISDFETKCIATVKDVERTSEPVIVTHRGRSMAKLEPIRNALKKKQLGALKGAMTVHVDLVNTDTTGDWEMLK